MLRQDGRGDVDAGTTTATHLAKVRAHLRFAHRGGSPAGRGWRGQACQPPLGRPDDVMSERISR
jgi:hypothetical protein